MFRKLLSALLVIFAVCQAPHARAEFSVSSDTESVLEYIGTLWNIDYGGYYYVEDVLNVCLLSGDEERAWVIEAFAETSGALVEVHFVNNSLADLTAFHENFSQMFELYDVWFSSLSPDKNIVETGTVDYSRENISAFIGAFPDTGMYELRKILPTDDRYLDEGWLKVEYERADPVAVAKIKETLAEMGDDSHGGFFEGNGSFFVYLLHEDDRIMSLAEEGHIVVVYADHSLKTLNSLREKFEGHLNKAYGICEVSVYIPANIVNLVTSDFSTENQRAIREAFPEIDQYQIRKTE